MADFAANLISVPSISAADVGGGSAAAAIVTSIPSLLTGPIFGPGADAVFVVQVFPIFTGELFLGWLAAAQLTPDTVLSPRAINRIYDSVAGKYVTWVTDGGDPAGAFYPGPGTYGVHTSNYVLVAYICSG